MYYYGKKTSELSENQRKERYLTAESRAVEYQTTILEKLINENLISEQEMDNLIRLGKLRHDLHTPLYLNARSIYLLESAHHERFVSMIDELNNLLGLAAWDWEEIPTSYDLIYECEHLDYEGELVEESYMEWSINIIADRLFELNDKALEFLKTFDARYDTNLTPTGFYQIQMFN